MALLGKIPLPVILPFTTVFASKPSVEPSHLHEKCFHLVEKAVYLFRARQNDFFGPLLLFVHVACCGQVYRTLWNIDANEEQTNN